MSLTSLNKKISNMKTTGVATSVQIEGKMNNYTNLHLKKPKKVFSFNTKLVPHQTFIFLPLSSSDHPHPHKREVG